MAITAVGALAYGIYHYAPIPSSEVRIGLAVLFALVGLAAIVGRVGGRRLPLVAADLLQYRLGGRCYAGTPAELARSEPPAPENDNPGLLQQMTEKMRHRLRRLRRKPRGRERRNGRMPLRPQRWLRNRRKPRDQGNGNGGHAAMRRTALLAAVALLALTAVAASEPPTPTPAPTPEPTPGPGTPYPQTSPDRWRNEIDFDPPDPVPGRRLYVEKLAVFEDRATVTLRAAAEIDLNVQAFGGPGGRELRFWGAASVAAGQSIFYTLPLSGDAPSFTFAWVDESGQAGGVSLKGAQLPHPLPVVEGELCDVRVTSIRWSPGALTGMLQAGECVHAVEHPIDLVVVQGEAYIAGAMFMRTRVTDVYGSVTVSSGDASTTVNLDPPGSAVFRLPIPTGEGLHELSVEATLEAHLRGNAPPLVTLELIPAREEYRLVPVKVWRPGTSKVVRDTVTVRNKDGTTSSHEILRPAHHPQRGDHRRALRPDQASGVHPGHGEPPRERVRQQGGDSTHGAHHRGRCTLHTVRPAAGGGGAASPRPDAADRGRGGLALRIPRLGVAVVRRLAAALTVPGAAAVSAAAGHEERTMLAAFDGVLTAMAYVAAGLAVFAVVWAGFVLMAEGSEPRNAGRARNAVAGALLGLVIVLSAKAIALALRSGIVPIP